jgi:hypothetical protein
VAGSGAGSGSLAQLDADGRPDPLPEELRLYDLRHTAASLMIRQGASVSAVQRQLGHATASITLASLARTQARTSRGAAARRRWSDTGSGVPEEGLEPSRPAIQARPPHAATMAESGC